MPRDRTAYYLKNKKKALTRSDARYKKEREHILKEGMRKYYDPENYPKYILWRVKARARRKNIPFNLVLTDIVIPKYCPFLGIPLERNVGNGHRNGVSSPSVDRIDPKKGYTRDNIQIISQQANVMKNSASRKELITFAKSIIKQYGA